MSATNTTCFIDAHKGLNSLISFIDDQQKQINDLQNKILDQQKQIDNLLKRQVNSFECLDMTKRDKTLPPNANLSAITNEGTYFMDAGNTAVNKPNEMTNNSFRLVVKRINSNNIQQELITAISDQNFTRVHQFSSGNWSIWKLH